MSIIGFKFLKDAPIGKETKGFFDFYHKSIAPALKTVIENDTCVHTIGLFGRWGTGKSTIVKILKDDGIADSNIVEFDCWKYENGLIVEVGGYHENVIRFLPPLTLTKKIAKNGLCIFANANKAMEASIALLDTRQ